MTVEMTTRKLESGRVSLPRAGLAALLAVTLLAGGLIGTAIYAGIGAPFAQPATGSVTLPPESMVVRDLRISAGRGPLTDLLRRRGRRVAEVELTSLDTYGGVDIAADFADRDLIADAIARLDPTRRAIVVMHYFLGMPLADVAEALEIPIGTVKSRLHRALGDMRVTVTTDPAMAPSPIPGGQVA